MIETSRNVSTFFFLTLSHTHSENVCCQSWILQREHAVRNSAKCACWGKAGPLNVLDLGTIWWPLHRHSSEAPRWSLGRARVSGGKSHTGHLQYNYAGTPHLGEEEMNTLPGLIFVGLLAPKSHFPAWWQWLTGSRGKGQRFWGTRITVVPGKSCGHQTQSGPQKNLANGYAETLSTEARPGTATQMLSSNTHVKGHVGCCFSNYQSNYYSPSD